jgi:photosystem II stability/assembly factor-like uncharacterized protein
MRARSLVLAALLAAGCGASRDEGPWPSVRIPTDAEFRGMWFTDSLNGWITGGGHLIDGGIVGRTRDGGRTWSFRSGLLEGGGRRFGLSRVQFLDSLRGCAVGSGGVILVTRNGGESWDLVHRGRSSGDDLSDVQFVDDENGWAAGSASILRTQDGGETWGALVYSTSENGYLSGNAVHFVDTRRGWLAGHSGGLFRSDDGGATWIPVPLPLRIGERPTLWDVTFTDASNGWVVGERGSIFHTSDGGANWTLQEAGVPVVRALPVGERRKRDVVPELEAEPDRLTISAIRFVDPRHGCATGYYADVAESVILRTSDGGTSWKRERVLRGELLRCVFLASERHAWAAGDRARTEPQVVLRYAP